MSKDTEYRPVPALNGRIQATNRRCLLFNYLIPLGLIFITMGVPGVFFGAINYYKANSFITEPGLCRVNAVGTEPVHTIKTSTNYPVWSVDIVKQADSDDATKNMTILRSNVLIQGTDGYIFAQEALEDAKVLHSVNSIK